MSVEKRENVIKQFKESQDEIAILLSLRATSTGLNLTMARNVFLVDPWWNPAIEDQAIIGADRIGQQNQVKVVRFLCRNTIKQQINFVALEKEVLNQKQPLVVKLKGIRVEELQICIVSVMIQILIFVNHTLRFYNIIQIRSQSTTQSNVQIDKKLSQLYILQIYMYNNSNLYNKKRVLVQNKQLNKILIEIIQKIFFVLCYRSTIKRETDCIYYTRMIISFEILFRQAVTWWSIIQPIHLVNPLGIRSPLSYVILFHNAELEFRWVWVCLRIDERRGLKYLEQRENERFKQN